MDHESISLSDQNDIEDGEISTSDDGYTPLKRPEPITHENLNDLPTTSDKMEAVSDVDDITLRTNSSESSDSDDNGYIQKKSTSIRLRPIAQLVRNKQKDSKYNIWSSGLQEETLTQNLQRCDVTSNNSKYSRDIESYDFLSKYRNNSSNHLKRRQSNSDCSENNYKDGCAKRFRGSKNKSKRRKNDINNKPRYIIDLTLTNDSLCEDVATEIANKLYEEKDDLLLQIVNVIGKDLAVQIFKETQEIEKNGGMLTLDEARRRTPGGVFLYLLKNHEEISQEDKKIIFFDERRASAKDKKLQQTKNREMKVEELKKTLKKDKDLPKLTKRKELDMSHLKPEAPYSMSNPPPSPVTDGNRENSSDYDTHPIQHVNVTETEKNHRESELNSYDDDFLDMNCDDMEFI